MLLRTPNWKADARTTFAVLMPGLKRGNVGEVNLLAATDDRSSHATDVFTRHQVDGLLA